MGTSGEKGATQKMAFRWAWKDKSNFARQRKKKTQLIGTLGQQIKDRNLKSESKSYHHLLYPYTSHLWHLFEGKKREREVISNTKHL